jgi:NAD(P)-dependent dehydrogenase (short-subunit alcohol dehydrogenase family)
VPVPATPRRKGAYPVRRRSPKDGKRSSDHDQHGELTRREGKLDILVNNAGVGGSDVKADDHAFLPLLHQSQMPVIVNVSSRLGAFGAMTDPDSYQYPVFAPAYGSPKSAVNMLTVQYAKALPELRINAVEPGLTATDLHGRSGPGVQTPAEGAEYVVRMATLGADGPTGTFSYEGPLPW